MFKKFHFIIFMVFLFQSFYLNSQTLERVKISGSVINSTTKQPVYLANIFLSNTTLGTTSNQAGYFTIKNIPIGKYELIVSMIGYEIEKRKLDLLNSKQLTINFELKPKILKREKITVIADQPLEWQKNLIVFKKLLFGPKSSAKECDILNPELIDFLFNKSSNTFQAFSEHPIIFENKSLGYKVTFFLDRFYVLLRPVKKSYIRIDYQYYKKDFLDLNVQKRFEAIKYSQDKEKKKWEKNRSKAYYGSIRHFLKSLFENNLKKEGFEYRGAKLEKRGDKSAFHPLKEYKIKMDSLLIETGNPFLRELTFSHYLRVTYKKERNEITNQDNQKSWLKISRGKKVIINANGLVNDDNAALISSGYWYWDGADEWLPNNYQRKDW